VDAIISAATGYGEADLQPFLRSIELSCPTSRVFLIVKKRDRALMEKMSHRFRFLHPVYTGWKFNRGGKVFRSLARAVIRDNFTTRRSQWIALGRYPLHIMLERFFFALDIVRTHGHSLHNVLLTDSRDVVFQKNPFEFIDGNAVSGLEEQTIGRCSINTGWLTHLYGREACDWLSDRKIICAGVTMGPAKEIEAYLTGMCSEIWRMLYKVALVAQYDQGIHNYLIYKGRLPVKLSNNGDGIIATLHHEDPNKIQADLMNGVTVQGKRPAIIHQYDRHRSLKTFVERRFE